MVRNVVSTQVRNTVPCPTAWFWYNLTRIRPSPGCLRDAEPFNVRCRWRLNLTLWEVHSYFCVFLLSFFLFFFFFFFLFFFKHKQGKYQCSPAIFITWLFTARRTKGRTKSTGCQRCCHLEHISPELYLKREIKEKILKYFMCVWDELSAIPVVSVLKHITD